MTAWLLFFWNIYRRIKSAGASVTEALYHQRRIFVSVLSVMMIIGLTTGGFGGEGKHAMTAFAETPPAGQVSSEGSSEKDFSEKYSSKKDSSGEKTSGDTSSLSKAHGDSADEWEEMMDSEEFAKAVENGQQVVGYLLKQEKEQKNQAEARRKGRAAEAEGRTKGQGSQDSDGGKEDSRKSAAGPGESEGAGGRQEEDTLAVSLSADDYQVLLKIVEAEAGVCDEKGKILVANVILNRVRDDEFPNTITKVVYQPSQFSPVANGTINTCKVTSETVACVRRALEGEDYSQGALYFMNRRASGSGNVRWFDGRLTFLFRHGSHEFFK